MKVISISSILFLTILFLNSCRVVDSSVTNSNIKFIDYPDYHCKDNTTKSDTTAFYHFSNQKDFEDKFFLIYDHNTPKTIPVNEFKDSHILAIVKTYNRLYKISIKSLSTKDGVLTVEYNSVLSASDMTWVAANTFVFTTPASFSHIIFVENGVKIRDFNL